LLKILTSVTWYGPKPGLYPASPVLKLNADGTCRIGYFIMTGETDPGFEYATGRFTLKGMMLEIEMGSGTGNDADRSIKGRYKDGRLIFEEGKLPALSDSDDPCSA